MILRRVFLLSVFFISIPAIMLYYILNYDPGVETLKYLEIAVVVLGIMYGVIGRRLFKKAIPIKYEKRIKAIENFVERNGFLPLNTYNIKDIANYSLYEDFWAREFEKMLKDYENVSKYVGLGTKLDWLRLYLACFPNAIISINLQEQYKIAEKEFDDLLSNINNDINNNPDKNWDDKGIINYINDNYRISFDEVKFNLFKKYLSDRKKYITKPVKSNLVKSELRELMDKTDREFAMKIEETKKLNENEKEEINNNPPNNPLIIELKDSEGEMVKAEIVKQYIEGDRRYVVANDLSNDEDCYILELRTTEMGDELISIDDEVEFNRLVALIEEAEKYAEENAQK